MKICGKKVEISKLSLFFEVVLRLRTLLLAILQSVTRNSLASKVQFTLHRHNLSILIKYLIHFPASMAGSESEAESESDVTPAGKENLDFDENTWKGEASSYSLTRSCC